jgi:hypothetical protein
MPGNGAPSSKVHMETAQLSWSPKFKIFIYKLSFMYNAILIMNNKSEQPEHNLLILFMKEF